MWRNVCAFVLVPSLVLAQFGPKGADMSDRSKSIWTDSTPNAHYYRYVRLRQGSTEKAVVRLVTREYVTSPRSPVPNIVPLDLGFQETSGIEVKDFGYPKAHPEFFAFHPQPIAVVDGKGAVVEFKVQATSVAALGVHTLTGRFAFQVVTDAGVSARQSVGITFQVTVVEHETEVSNGGWSILVAGDSTDTAGISRDQSEAPSLRTQGESDLRQFISYSGLRQGTTENGKVVLALAPDTFVTSPRSPVEGIIPLSLEFQERTGIRTKDFTDPKSSKHSFEFHREPLPVVFPDGEVEFKIQADDNAALGPQMLSGKLTFQLITNNGVSTRQEIPVQFPVTVVKHTSKVHKTTWARSQTSGTTRALLIMAAPLVIVYIIVCIPGSILGYCKGS